MNNQTAQEGKTLGVVSYLTFIGLIIAASMNLEKKNPYIFFHIRQMLGLIIMLIVANVSERFVNSYFGTFLWIIVFISWSYCLIFSILGQAKLLPIFGKYFQDWFSKLK